MGRKKRLRQLCVGKVRQTTYMKDRYERQITQKYDAIIADEEDEECFKLTVWGGLIENISDGHTYIIKSVLLEDYYGLTLNTTGSTFLKLTLHNTT